jgi:uncharacterized protein involved in outer membrane biogenesis
MANVRKHGRRALIAAAALFAVYTVFGFLVAPPIVRAQLEKRASAVLSRPVTVEKVRINPLAFSVSVDGLRVAARDGGDLASWTSACVNFDPLASLFRGEWRFAEVRLVEPRQRVVVAADGSLEFAELAGAAPAQPPAGAAAPPAIPAVSIGRLEVAGWTADFTDLSRAVPFHTVAGPMSFQAAEIATAPGSASPYSFTGATDTGLRFSWSGSNSLQPLASRGRLEISGLSAPKHAPLHGHLHAADIRSGTVSISGDYEVALGEAMAARVSGMRIALEGWSVGLRGAEAPAVAFDLLEVLVDKADLAARSVEISRIALDGLDVRVERRKDGTIDLAGLLRGEQPPSGAAPPSASAGPAPSVRVATASLTRGRAALVDHTTAQPARFVADRISLTATGAGTDLGREVGIDFAVRWAEGGEVAVAGTVRPVPLAASLRLAGDALDLRPFEPFLAAFAGVRLRGGQAGFEGRIDVEQAPGAAPNVRWAGDWAVDDLAVTDAEGASELLRWKRLACTGSAFSLEPLALAAAEIRLTEPNLHATVNEDGIADWAAALPSAGKAPEPAAEPANSERTSEIVARASRQPLPFKADVGAIVIEGGAVRFDDRSVQPAFAAELRGVEGSVRGLSSASLARADVELRAALDGVAPLEIAGRINPLADDAFTDLSLVFSNIDLPVFTPYAARFLGQTIQKGKLRIAMTWKVSQRVLEGENTIVFDQFYLGDKVPSPDALGLPIGLALAVMRDRDGRIPLEFPVRGNLDDPDFKYGKMVWRAVGNIVAKAATAPFSLLGGLFGGGQPRQLEHVDFASGSAALSEDAAGTLEVLAKALAERPALRLEITAPPMPAGDRAGLAATLLAGLLQAERQQMAAGADEAAAVRSVFARLFPDEAAMALPVSTEPAANPPPAAAGEPAGQRPSLLSRTWRRLFGGRGRPAGDAGPAAGPKPATAPGAAAPAAEISVEAMRQRILATIEPAESDAADLARARAQAVRERLLADGAIAAERLFLVDGSTVPAGRNAPAEGGRVFFDLR